MAFSFRNPFDIVLSRYVAQVFSERFWDGSSCSYSDWYQFCVYVPQALCISIIKVLIFWIIYIYIYCGPSSSVGIATELRAGRSGIESRRGRDFLPVQTGPGAQSASCTMGSGSFPGVKCGRGVLLTTRPLLVPRSWKSRAIPLPALWSTPGLWRDHFTLYIYIYIYYLLLVFVSRHVHKHERNVNWIQWYDWVNTSSVSFIALVGSFYVPYFVSLLIWLYLCTSAGFIIGIRVDQLAKFTCWQQSWSSPCA